MPEPAFERGVLDTCLVIDLPKLAGSGLLPREAAVSAITLAELSYGVATAKTPLDAVRRAALQAQVQRWFEPLPFEGDAALKYGELVALVVAEGRHPRPRRIDLMIAAVAAANGLPLFTANADDFRGLAPVVEVVSVEG